MKFLAIVTFILGICVTSVHAEAQKPVIFNGMVFDAPPEQGWSAPPAAPKANSSGQKAHRPQTFGIVSVAGQAIPHLVTQAGSFEQSMERNRNSTCADLVQ